MESSHRNCQEKLADLQKQNTILSDYISLKESTHAEKVRRLEEDLRQKSEELDRCRKEIGPAQRSRIRISVDREKPESIDSLSPIKHIDSTS